MNLISRLFGSPVRQIAPAEVKALMSQNPKPYLLDVRQPEEYRQGHIPGARLIPLGELSRRAGELPRDRDIVCICRSGNRSGSATRQLSAAGFKAVNMSGGMLSWTRSGLPVKKGS